MIHAAESFQKSESSVISVRSSRCLRQLSMRIPSGSRELLSKYKTTEVSRRVTWEVLPDSTYRVVVKMIKIVA
ncbi:hypothetical protein WN55_03449 [Dufourea novaeangliae]|uniref:Uncharacterized protein n=1 Tax=Dufourea novaeangliae TaxID=178035 RepID=A0A154PJC2_DUFNO|nr:hypothetical protein WN55_03449 [Dufourea novaeangliae]